MAQDLFSKALPKLAVGAVAVISAFGILKVIEIGKNIGVAAAIDELTSQKEQMIADIQKEKELNRSKVSKVYESLDTDLHNFFTNWNLEAVKANPDKAKIIVDELAKVGFPLAEKIKVATDWAGTKPLASVVGFLGEEASKLLQPATKIGSSSPQPTTAAAPSTPAAAPSTPAAVPSTPAAAPSTPAAAHSTPSAAHSTHAAAQSTPAPSQSTTSAAQSTAAHSTPAPAQSTPAAPNSTPAAPNSTPAPAQSTAASTQSSPAATEGTT